MVSIRINKKSSKNSFSITPALVVRGPNWVWNLRGRAVDLISEVQYAGEVAPICSTLELFFRSVCTSPISYGGPAITTISCLFRGSFIPLIEWYRGRRVYFICREFKIWFCNSQQSFECHILCVVTLRKCGPKLARCLCIQRVGVLRFLFCTCSNADNTAHSSPLLCQANGGCILRLSVYIEILCIMGIALLLTSGGRPKHSKKGGGMMMMMCFEATKRYQLSTAHLTQWSVSPGEGAAIQIFVFDRPWEFVIWE